MAVITSEERRLITDLITHHESELAVCLDMSSNPDNFTPREVAKAKETCEEHKRLIERLRMVLVEAVVN